MTAEESPDTGLPNQAAETELIQQPASPQQQPQPAPPPAAQLVVQAGKSERELALEAELERARERAKRAEIEAAYAQDELHRLKASAWDGQRQQPAQRKRKPSFGWFETDDE